MPAYEALKGQFKDLVGEIDAVEEGIQECETTRRGSARQAPERRVETALGFLDDVRTITETARRRAEVGTMLNHLGVKIGLSFATVVKGRRRRVQKLVSGRMVFGDASLPVPLFGNENVQDPSASKCVHGQNRGGSDACKSELTHKSAVNSADKQCNAVGMVPTASNGPAGDPTGRHHHESQPEGISITKYSRGDWI